MDNVFRACSRYLLSTMPLATAAIALCAAPAFADRDHNREQIRVLSSPPDLVSGGDALVQIQLGRLHERDVRVTLNGQDITSDFHRTQMVGVLIGLVSGLRIGTNHLELLARGRRPVA